LLLDAADGSLMLIDEEIDERRSMRIKPRGSR